MSCSATTSLIFRDQGHLRNEAYAQLQRSVYLDIYHENHSLAASLLCTDGADGPEMNKRRLFPDQLLSRYFTIEPSFSPVNSGIG